MLEKVFNYSAQKLEEKVTQEHLWCGRNVLVIDGSTVSMPDTVENQKEYPQPSSQKPECGFPIAKIGVIFSQIKTPIALFLPGSRVDISQYSQFANIVASYGFTVIIPEHIRSLPDFGFTGLIPEASQICHVLDFMLAENSNANSPIAGTLDLDKLVLLGHSFGGAVGLTAIDNSCIYPVCEGEFQRPQQLQAAAFFATNTFVGIGKFIPIRNQGIPIALILGSQDGSSVTPQTTQTSYDLIQESPKALITIEGANHYGITNINNPPGARPDPNIPTLTQEKSIETIARWSALFLLAHTLGDRNALDYVNNTGDTLDENVTVTRH